MPTITLSLHGDKHCNKYCRWHPRDLFQLGQDDHHMGGWSDRAVVALDENGHLVGVWQYDITRYGGRTTRVSSCGTWVDPKYRKHGIAQKMWEFGLAHENPKRVYVAVITDRGYTLAQSMKDRLPKFKWEIYDGGDRQLRKLSK